MTPHDGSTVHDRTAAIAALGVSLGLSLGLTSETGAPDDATSAAMGLASEEPGSTTSSGAPDGAQELATALDTLREQVSGLVAAVPERARPEQVDAWLASFRRLEGAVAGLRTRLVGCVQVSRAHESGGHAAPTTYLKEALGVSGREAARQDKLARDLRGLPQTQQALTDGDIGPEQAQAIGRSARNGVLGDPGATETQLLPLARTRGAEDLSDEIRRLEQEADRKSLELAERRAYRRRRGTLVRRRDGMWDLQALLTDEHGEALATALDAFRTFDPPGTPIPEQRSPAQRTADAIADLVRTATQGGRAPSSGGLLPQLNVVVPLEALDPDGAAVGELAHGGVLSTAGLERLLCDAKVRRFVTRGDSEVLDAGRSRQHWSVAQRQALRVRDGGCRGPGCDRPVAWTHAHHVVPWSKDGPTSVDNGLLLCSFHHHQVHEGGWTVTLDTTTAAAVFRSPSGRKVTTQPHRRGGPRHSPTPGDPLRRHAGSAGSTAEPTDSAADPTDSAAGPTDSAADPTDSAAGPTDIAAGPMGEVGSSTPLPSASTVTDPGSSPELDSSSPDLGGLPSTSAGTVPNGATATPHGDTRRRPAEAAPTRSDADRATAAAPTGRTPDDHRTTPPTDPLPLTLDLEYTSRDDRSPPPSQERGPAGDPGNGRAPP
ncbi:MAG: DUF222 domain-containing protein [Nitriliruptoraceae bacterium]